MLLTVLGCSGRVPGPAAPASGYLLEADGFVLAIELGSGTVAALQAIRDPFELDALLFSHLHADHCSDFSSLTVYRRYHPKPSRDPRQHRLPVYAPSSSPARFVAAYATDAADAAVTDLTDVFDFRTVTSGTFDIGPFEVVASRAAHPCEAFSFRFTHGGRSLVFTGDTGVCAGLTELVDGVDVLLTEASWTHAADRPVDLHMSGRDAGEVASAGGVDRVLVTHLPPWADADAILAEVRAAYAGEVVRVEQGATYDI